MRLGIKTDTGDSEGKVLEKDNFILDLEKIEDYKRVFDSFKGKQMQLPPMYSALKVNGKKLYEYARDGIEVERHEREIEVYSIDILKVLENSIEFEVECSKGTYIRTLCESIAERLGTIGFMESLIRTKVDNFSINDSFTLEKIENSGDREKCVISIEKLFENRDKIDLNESKLKLFINGGRLKTDFIDGLYRVYFEDKFIGLGNVKDNILKRDIVLE